MVLQPYGNIASRVLKSVPRVLHYRFANGVHHPTDIRLPVGAKVPWRPTFLERNAKGQPTGAWMPDALDAFASKFEVYGLVWSYLPVSTDSGKRHTALMYPQRVSPQSATVPQAPVAEKLREHLDARLRNILGAERTYITSDPFDFANSSAMYPHTDGIEGQHWHESLGVALYYPKQVQGGHLFLRPRQLQAKGDYRDDSLSIYGKPVKGSPEFLIPNVRQAFTLSAFSQKNWLHRGSMRCHMTDAQGQKLPKHHYASNSFSTDK
ncbi:MAG: hypothetical protein ACKO37_08655 [Vampirovibrionales bacterium]